ncbi:MAG: hypothetical protein QXO27_04285 [Candidatus Aenigmatarchaeota archaeon]
MAYAQNKQNINAYVLIIPSSKIECKPNVLTINSTIKWINCFIELIGANVEDIPLSDLRLGVIEKPGLISPDLTFSHIDDFDSDGVLDLQIRFNRSLADINWFNETNTTTLFNLVLTGTVDGFPFSGNDILLLVKSSPFQQAHYHPMDSQLTVPEETIKYIEGIDLSKYEPKKSAFSGFFVSRGDPEIFGINNFYSEGFIKIPRKVKLLFFNVTVYDKQPVTISAIFKKYDDCYADNVSKNVYCQGSGILLVRNHKIEKTTRYNLDILRFEIRNYTAKLEGGKYWNDMIRIDGVKIKMIRIK